MVALARFVLASLALLIIYIDPTEPDQLVEATYATLIGYVVFSGIIYWNARADRTIISPWLNNPYWLDVFWYLVLISLSSGTGSVFFFFFYFAILNAAFTDGFRCGMMVTGIATLAFTLLGYIAAISANAFELDRFLLRPISMVVLGYLISHWGGHQVRTLSRLRLLREIGLISNPRFGVDRTLSINVELLRRFFQAEKGLLIERTNEGQFTMRSCDDSHPGGGIEPVFVPAGLGESLMSLPTGVAAYCHFEKIGKEPPACRVYDLASKSFVPADPAPFQAVAEQIEAAAFVTVPLNINPTSESRLFLYSAGEFLMHPGDIEFLVQALDHFSPIVSNVSLIDSMATEAADEERQRIARDIHDSIIQPYIGLQMGIDSLLQVTGDDGNGNGVIRKRLQRLRELTESGVSDLRAYIGGLKTGRGERNLEASLRRYSARFNSATGIDVSFKVDENVHLTDRLAAEVFQIIVEGLSNIRRHTESAHATVTVTSCDRKLEVSVINNGARPSRDFQPKSISGRAAALGGTASVNVLDDSTSVVVQIPL